MKPRALIVEDSSDIAESVCDTLDSLGHEFIWVKSQEEAREKITEGGFSYVLLDLQIPVRFGRGLPRLETGEHLAREIHGAAAMRGVPIIVMTAYGKEGLEMAAPLVEHGVVDFVTKPFAASGRTLSAVIQAVVARSRILSPAPVGELGLPTRPFSGGELVIDAARAELCGVCVLSNSNACQMWRVLHILTQKLHGGRFKAFDGEALARLLKCSGGQGSIAGSIRDFRRQVGQRLASELGIKVGQQDVVETSKAGYRLRDWISVKMLAPFDTDDCDGVRRSAIEDMTLSRQEKILALLRSGENWRVPMIARELGISFATVKREVEVLKESGRVEFVGSAKAGGYMLTRQIMNVTGLAAVK